MSTTEPEKKYKASKYKSKDSKEKEKHRSRDKDDRKHKKRRKHEDDLEDDTGRKHKHRKKDKGTKEEKLEIVDDDVSDDGMWVEKNIDMDGERVRDLSSVMCTFSSRWYNLGTCYRYSNCGKPKN